MTEQVACERTARLSVALVPGGVWIVCGAPGQERQVSFGPTLTGPRTQVAVTAVGARIVATDELLRFVGLPEVRVRADGQTERDFGVGTLALDAWTVGGRRLAAVQQIAPARTELQDLQSGRVFCRYPPHAVRQVGDELWWVDQDRLIRLHPDRGVRRVALSRSLWDVRAAAESDGGLIVVSSDARGVFRVERDGALTRIARLTGRPSTGEDSLAVTGALAAWAETDHGQDQVRVARVDAEDSDGQVVLEVPPKSSLRVLDAGFGRVAVLEVEAGGSRWLRLLDLPELALPAHPTAVGPSLGDPVHVLGLPAPTIRLLGRHGITRVSELIERLEAVPFRTSRERVEVRGALELHRARVRDPSLPVRPLDETFFAPVEALGLPAALVTRLERAGIEHVAELLVRTEADLRDACGIGPAALDTLRTSLSARGWALGRGWPELVRPV